MEKVNDVFIFRKSWEAALPNYTIDVTHHHINSYHLPLWHLVTIE